MSSPRPFDGLSALRTVLTILALGAGGLLLLLLLIVTVGGSVFDVPGGSRSPEAAGLAVGEFAPPLEAAGWLNGEPEGYDGRITVVQGWFYDCPYCWQEAPELAKLHKKYGDRVAFVGLTSDPPSDLEKVEEFVETGGLNYPIGYGAVPTLIGFKAQFFPVLWLVGPDGTVIWNLSLDGQQTLEQAIEAALKPPKKA